MEEKLSVTLKENSHKELETSAILEAEKCIMQTETSSVIEKPNYDFIEEVSPEESGEKQTIVLEETKPKKSYSFRKKIVICLLLIVGTISSAWCVYNGFQIASTNANIAEVGANYSLNLANYVKKIAQLDGANRGKDLIETYPEELESKTEHTPKSNWFDKICNFLSSLFGG